MPTSEAKFRELTVVELPDKYQLWLCQMLGRRARCGHDVRYDIAQGMLWVVWKTAVTMGSAREDKLVVDKHGGEDTGMESQDGESGDDDGTDGKKDIEDGEGSKEDIEHGSVAADGARDVRRLRFPSAPRTASSDARLQIAMLQERVASLRQPTGYKRILSRMITERFERGYSLGDDVFEGMEWALSEVYYDASNLNFREAGDALVVGEDGDDLMESDEEGEINDGSEAEENEVHVALVKGIDAPAVHAMDTYITNRLSTDMAYEDENIPAAFNAGNEVSPGERAYADAIDRAIMYGWINEDAVAADLGYGPL
ncbi:hypothetical protein OE88DRAFT_215091 [Heliocybe sulcata]|uniref:Uncharacterized protein n=1 Tax=Heliocybe sulcata TaxID=5364 RepID=A0A5C3N197_9AGAM|nr:hypothetical protein OE88DRAFT_215091 [Heliocybe sulcata]